MRYLVTASEGPGFSSPEEAVHVLEKIVLPSFEALIELEKGKKILGGGLPVGDRAFVFIMEASSNEEVDRLLRSLPMWGALKWKVTALQTQIDDLRLKCFIGAQNLKIKSTGRSPCFVK